MPNSKRKLQTNCGLPQRHERKRRQFSGSWCDGVASISSRVPTLTSAISDLLSLSMSAAALLFCSPTFKRSRNTRPHGGHSYRHSCDLAYFCRSVLTRKIPSGSGSGCGKVQRCSVKKMAATTVSLPRVMSARRCTSSQRLLMPNASARGSTSEISMKNVLSSSYRISSKQSFSLQAASASPRSSKVITRVLHAETEKGVVTGLPIDLRGKRAFIAGVADDNGYGWAIAKALAAAGAEILVGTWVPALNIFETSLNRGKFDESRLLPNGSLLEIAKIYPLDAVYDSPEDVPEDVRTSKRYAGASNWTVKEVVESVKSDFGSIDILIHSLANGPEVTKPLLETSRKGYLAALSASTYSFVSLLQHFLPIMNSGGATISLTHHASERTIPGYGGGMNSAKAALESDTRVLAFEAGRKGKIRVNTISAGPLRSRAAKAIGFVERMMEYSYTNSPLQKELLADEVGYTAAFLVSPLASAITGSVVYVDNGLNTMGLATDSPTLSL